jgi:hypothetical protein
VVNYNGTSPVGTWTGSTYDGITGMIKTGFNGGSWNGNGIRTSSGTTITSLGVAEATQALNIGVNDTGTFSGESVDGTSVLVKYTYVGDATLDGKVAISDYAKIDFNFGQGTRGWFNGDFNFDGLISISDYGKIDYVIGVQGAPL